MRVAGAGIFIAALIFGASESQKHEPVGADAFIMGGSGVLMAGAAEAFAHFGRKAGMEAAYLVVLQERFWRADHPQAVAASERPTSVLRVIDPVTGESTGEFRRSTKPSGQGASAVPGMAGDGKVLPFPPPSDAIDTHQKTVDPGQPDPGVLLLSPYADEHDFQPPTEG